MSVEEGDSRTSEAIEQSEQAVEESGSMKRKLEAEAAPATKAATGDDKGDSKGGTRNLSITEQDRQTEKKRRTQMMNMSRDLYQQALQDRQRRAAAAAQAALGAHSRLLALQQQQAVQAARAQAATTAVLASAPAELPRPQPQRLFPMRHEEQMVVQEVQDAGRPSHFLVAVQCGSAHNEPGLASANRGSAQRYGSETYFNSRNFTHAPTAAFAPVVSHRDPLAFGDGRPHIMGFPQVNAESLAALSSVLHSRVEGAEGSLSANARLANVFRPHDQAFHTHNTQMGNHMLPTCVPRREEFSCFLPTSSMFMTSTPEHALAPYCDTYAWCQVAPPVRMAMLSGASAVAASGVGLPQHDAFEMEVNRRAAMMVQHLIQTQDAAVSQNSMRIANLQRLV
jgi:hypothetical protein